MDPLNKLLVFNKSFTLAMEIFKYSNHFPKEEKYALTDQIRRSSRSVSANLAEAYRKRSYIKHFILKLSDCDAENLETQVWLAFAFNCGYLNKQQYDDLQLQSIEIGKLLGYMIRHPEKFM